MLSGGNPNGIIHATNCIMMNLTLPTDRATRWIFLSPHLDDAVFSCGGLISFLSGNGIDVEIWTIFSDQEEDPECFTEFVRSLHTRWQSGDHPYEFRKREDATACKIVGARQVHFGYLDCVYRVLPESGKPVITSNEELLQGIRPEESYLVRKITSRLQKRLTESSIWVCPLGLGNHMDHQITRQAAEKVRQMMLYYADLPYAFRSPALSFPGMIQLSFDLPEKNIQQWGRANLQYVSQISTFWKDAAEMAGQYSRYLETYKGLPLWLSKPSEEERK